MTPMMAYWADWLLKRAACAADRQLDNMGRDGPESLLTEGA